MGILRAINFTQDVLLMEQSGCLLMEWVPLGRVMVYICPSKWVTTPPAGCPLLHLLSRQSHTDQNRSPVSSEGSFRRAEGKQWCQEVVCPSGTLLMALWAPHRLLPLARHASELLT